MIDCRLCKHHYIHFDVKKGDTSIDFCDLNKLHGQTPPIMECSYFEKIPTETQEGKKYDNGKNRMGLMCENFSRALWEVARVSTFGSQKYGDNTWQNLSNPKQRYMDALCRHLFQHLQGDKVDNESGLLHLQHCAWNILALLEFELKENIEKIDN